MKKLSLILVVAIMFASCKKDDEPQNQTEEPPVDYYAQFVGSWDVRFLDNCTSTQSVPDGTQVQVITFNADGTGNVLSNGTQNDPFTVSATEARISGDLLSFSYWDYSYSGDTLVLVSSPIGCNGTQGNYIRKAIKL